MEWILTYRLRFNMEWNFTYLMEDGSDFDAYQRIHTGKMTGLNNGMINVVPKKYIYLKTNVLVF